MKRTFNLLTTIELNEKQEQLINSIISAIKKYDVNKEVDEIYLSLVDVTDDVLNEEFCPVIFTNTKHPSDNLYEGVRNDCELVPEYISKEELIPTSAVVLWKRGE